MYNGIVKTEYALGKLFNLQLSLVPSAWISTIVMWIGLSIVALDGFGFSLTESILAALVAVALHWLSETWHQLGHALAARRTGYPMLGIRFWGVLSTSVYPRDEPTLPAAVHIRRALGGPVASFFVTLIAAGLFLLLNVTDVRGRMWYLALFCALENLLVFCLGALLPLGFTDGSTILYWWGKK